MTALPALRGPLVTLRALAPSDAPWIAEACARPEMARFLPALPVPYGRADAEAFLTMSAREWASDGDAPFAICAAQDERPLGVITLHRHEPGRASVGYWVRHQERRRGVATAALLLVAGWAFADLGVVRLELTADPSNVGSQVVAERCGFRREGVLRAHKPTRERGRRDSVLFVRVAGAS